MREISLVLPKYAAVVLLLSALFGVQAFFSYEIYGSRSVPPPGTTDRVENAGVLWQIGRRPEFAFGFRNFVADIAWMKAVQVAGAKRMSRADYDRLEHFLEIVENIDPRFEIPYLLGAILLGNSPDHVASALETLERGRQHHPTQWLFPFYSGYIKYFSLGDPVGGGKALEEAARIPDSPPYLPLLASRMLTEGREPETALAFLQAILQQETDPARIRVLESRIKEVIVEKDIQALERAVAEYRRRKNENPPTLLDLVREGLIRRVPVEPHGGRYLLSRNGDVRSDKVAGRLKVLRPR